MPQDTNLNVSPYFDDFDRQKNFYKVLYKPGFPVQARELTTSQSILQNQIEQLGTNILKPGSAVTGGQRTFFDSFTGVQLQKIYQGINVDTYVSRLVGKQIIGRDSKVSGVVRFVLPSESSPTGNPILYVSYQESSLQSSQNKFSNGETLITTEDLAFTEEGITAIPSGSGFALSLSQTSDIVGSAFGVQKGVFFIKGFFVDVEEQLVLLDPIGNKPTYSVGLRVFEEIITSDEDSSLNDNSRGFSNFAAPGADRLKITATLEKREIASTYPSDYIELFEVKNGIIQTLTKDTQFNVIGDELARRTFDESGNYYVTPFKVSIENSLNDFKGSQGLFEEGVKTFNNNDPSDSLGIYQISPGKAYVQGFEIVVPGNKQIDFAKPRSIKTLTNQGIYYNTGSTLKLNNVFGIPNIGITTTTYISLRSQRLGSSRSIAPGKEIGVARIYDIALESGSYNAQFLSANQWDLSLFDIQPFTDLNYNVPVSLSVPTHIKGKSSGAVGFLRYNVSNSGIITAYNVSGKFLPGEKLIFDGIENVGITTLVTEYKIDDVKSVYSSVRPGRIFSADVIQTVAFNTGTVAITSVSQSTGISTISSSTFEFFKFAKENDIVSFTNPQNNSLTYAKVVTSSSNNIQIVGVTNVSGVVSGSLPTSTTNLSNVAILKTRYQGSVDDTLYTVLPNDKVSSVNLETSSVKIRKQIEGSITNGAFTTPVLPEDQTFDFFDEERYSLVRSNGQIVPISESNFTNLSSNSRQITLTGLGQDGNATLTATVKKQFLTNKTKTINSVESIVFNKSKLLGSGTNVGTGDTTLNDGLQFGNFAYGTRVQDQEICLLYPDVTKIYGVFQSTTTSDPILPQIILSDFSGPSQNTSDLINGEEFIGTQSKAVGILVNKNSLPSGSIEYVLLNSGKFIVGETIRFKSSGITASLNSIIPQRSVDITDNYTFDNGQRGSIYDYSKLIRKSSAKEPDRKIRVVFQRAIYSDSDNGNVITVNSYNNFDYCNIPRVNRISNYNLIDFRPRVSDYTISESSRSPLEFFGRNLENKSNSSLLLLVPDETILLDYSYYLPRIDRIFLSKDGELKLKLGEPSENPLPPTPIDGAMEIATVILPAYLCDLSSAVIKLTDHKRYRMKDIKLLEDRIKNLEFYTTLSLLESNTTSLQIKDSQGIDRFKSGFFVDDFTSRNFQYNDKRFTSRVFKNSIKKDTSELRPSVYQTSIDLSLGLLNANNNLIRLSEDEDSRFDGEIIGANVVKSTSVDIPDKGILTLEFSEVEEITQPFATRVENVNPYLVTFFRGILDLNPSSDIWIDQIVIGPKDLGIIDGRTDIVEVELLAEPDPSSGFAPVIFGATQFTWTDQTTTVISESDIFEQNGQWFKSVVTATTRVGTSTRTGTTNRITFTDTPTSFGSNTIKIEIATYMRARNVEFLSKKLKPSTRLYPFFDGVNVSRFCTPKLIEITMVKGTFITGETVETDLQNSTLDSTIMTEVPFIRFRAAKQNHYNGPFNNPTSTYPNNIYTREPLQAEYSSTSTLLNVDTFSLSDLTVGNFYGYVTTGMRLIGKTSKAVAIVRDVRLLTDRSGNLRGVFWIPNPNVSSNPRFATGEKIFRLTSDESNLIIPGSLVSVAEDSYYSKGTINTSQETVGTVRNTKKEIGTLTLTTPASETIVNDPVLVPVPKPPVPVPVPAPIPIPVPVPVPAPRPVPVPIPVASPVPVPVPIPVPVPRPVPVPVPVAPPPPPPTPTLVTKFVYIANKTKSFPIPGGTQARFECVGAGGGGGCNNENIPQDQRRGAGGGGGAYGSGVFNCPPGTEGFVRITVGRGGSRGTPSNIAGQPGADTIVETSTSQRIVFEGGRGAPGNRSGGRGGAVIGNNGPSQSGTGGEQPGSGSGFGGRGGNAGGASPTSYDNSSACQGPFGQIFLGGLGGGGRKIQNVGLEPEKTFDPSARDQFGNRLCTGVGGRGQNRGGGGGGGAFGQGGGDGGEGLAFLEFQGPAGGVISDTLQNARIDPLAQSFFIQDPNGRFATSIELYFQSKDAVLPVIVELRPMRLGLPTEEIYPFSQVTLFPDQINISDDGSLPTRIEFNAPVFLTGNTEHALVVKSDSSEYNAWISQLGEVDITTANAPESERNVISTQPDISKIGVLFKSQNASTWTPSQFEDLKFKLFTAVFESEGSVSFFNPDLNQNNNQLSRLIKNSIEVDSKKIRIGLSTDLINPNVNIGNTIIQPSTGAFGNLVGRAGSITGNLTISNPGIGYTPSDGSSQVYLNIPLISLTGTGKDATADITIGRGDSDGVAIAATVSNGGMGYEVGEVLTISPPEALGANGRNIVLTVDQINEINEIVLDNVQGNFITGAGSSLSYKSEIGGVGITTSLGGNTIISIMQGSIVTVTDGLHLRVNCSNHGMHALTNQVLISNVAPDVPSTVLTQNYESDSLQSIALADVSNFTTFEGVGVSTSNPGYVKIGSEIIKYTGVSTVENTLTGITRNVESLIVTDYVANFARVYKYEIEGVSLRRINKLHLLQDATVEEPIGLDYFTIRIDMSNANDIGVDRTGNASLPALFFPRTKNIGGSEMFATTNIQYEILEPNVSVSNLPGTAINASVRTISGTSISGTEPSFIDQGFTQINLNQLNYFSSPRIICSTVNEQNLLGTLPYNRSFELNLDLTTTNNRLSPVVDLDRVGINLISNRVNSVIKDYYADNRVSTIVDDPSAFVYVSKPISLEFSASSLKVIVAAYVNQFSDLRALYATLNDPNDSPIYYPFPGFSNINGSGQVIDPRFGDGTPDIDVPKNALFSQGNTPDYFKDYEFTVDDIGSFKYFSIKLIGSSSSQAFPPRLRDLRVIALA